MKSLLILVLSLSSAMAFALPKAPFDALKTSVSHLKGDGENQDYDFEGIIKLSNCSGSLIIFNGMPTSAKAIVMTNGHCMDKADGTFLKPGEAWVNRTWYRTVRMFDANMELYNLKITRVLYATMTQTDVTFYEVEKTYDEILSRYNIRPFLLDGSHPIVGQPIEIISGYWDRGYRCDIHSFVFEMREDLWTWKDSIRYTPTCDTKGGTSGSPIVAAGERRVIGINNTGNEDGKVCTMNNPCEVSEDGDIFAQKGLHYGQQTFNVYNCLTPDFTFDLNRPGCELPR